MNDQQLQQQQQQQQQQQYGIMDIRSCLNPAGHEPHVSVNQQQSVSPADFLKALTLPAPWSQQSLPAQVVIRGYGDYVAAQRQYQRIAKQQPPSMLQLPLQVNTAARVPLLPARGGSSSSGGVDSSQYQEMALRSLELCERIQQFARQGMENAQKQIVSQKRKNSVSGQSVDQTVIGQWARELAQVVDYGHGVTSNKSSTNQRTQAASATAQSQTSNNGVRKCRSCNTTETTVWRRGPDGEATLCHACGLSYVRLLNQRQQQGVPRGDDDGMSQTSFQHQQSSAATTSTNNSVQGGADESYRAQSQQYDVDLVDATRDGGTDNVEMQQ